MKHIYTLVLAFCMQSLLVATPIEQILANVDVFHGQVEAYEVIEALFAKRNECLDIICKSLEIEQADTPSALRLQVAFIKTMRLEVEEEMARLEREIKKEFKIAGLVAENSLIVERALDDAARKKAEIALLESQQK